VAVYFIRAGEEGPVKIGTAENVNARLHALQNAHYAELTVIRLLEGDHHLELQIHERFKARRIRREWFDFDQAMLTEDFSVQKAGLIDRLIKSYGSQRAMSTATGFGQVTISKWRNGWRPSLKSSMRLIQLANERLQSQ
jgi:hypothetical protein